MSEKKSAPISSKFLVDGKAQVRGIFNRWRAARRIRRADPESAKLMREGLKREKKAKKQKRLLRLAGFFDDKHYQVAKGAYCECGSVQDHNKKFDEIVEAKT